MTVMRGGWSFLALCLLFDPLPPCDRGKFLLSSSEKDERAACKTSTSLWPACLTFPRTLGNCCGTGGIVRDCGEGNVCEICRVSG